MKTVTRIVTYLVCVVIHVSGIPNPTAVVTDECRCLSFAEAEARGLNISALREEYTVNDFSGRSMFSIMLFEPDGHIAWVFYRGLEPDEEPVFCEVVEKLSEDYRFPLESSSRFSQCGTTHFKEK